MIENLIENRVGCCEENYRQDCRSRSDERAKQNYDMSSSSSIFVPFHSKTCTRRKIENCSNTVLVKSCHDGRQSTKDV
jgi:hypothetical protein